MFGSTVAIALAKAGYRVELFDSNGEILASASGINQYRLHRGYHYPRSMPTALSSRLAEPYFISEYGEALLENTDHYYCIANEGSFVSGKLYLDFCDEAGLEYEQMELPSINKNSVQLVIKVRESIIDPHRLRKIIYQKIESSGIHLRLGATFSSHMVTDFNYVINCTYANLNGIFCDAHDYKEIYQFELCEKPVLRLPTEFANQSIVIMDGPFMCIDPYAETGCHVMGNVVHAIHASNTGHHPIIPDQFKSLLNNGVVKDSPVTNIKQFIESAAYFMPGISKAEHIGSMFTIRTVLPNVESTDERPTLVSRVNEKIINVLSGKLGNSVEVSLEVLGVIRGR